jgi:hypothetical protein
MPRLIMGITQVFCEFNCKKKLCEKLWGVVFPHEECSRHRLSLESCPNTSAQSSQVSSTPHGASGPVGAHLNQCCACQRKKS